MSFSLGKAVILVGGAYLAPKVLSYLTTHPDDITSTIGKIREYLAHMRDVLEAIAGEDLWFVISKIIGENGWIGVAGVLGLHYYLSLKAVSVIPTTALFPTFMDRVASIAERIEKTVVAAGVFSVCATSACVGRMLLDLAWA